MKVNSGKATAQHGRPTYDRLILPRVHRFPVTLRAPQEAGEMGSYARGNTTTSTETSLFTPERVNVTCIVLAYMCQCGVLFARVFQCDVSFALLYVSVM